MEIEIQNKSTQNQEKFENSDQNQNKEKKIASEKDQNENLEQITTHFTKEINNLMSQLEQNDS